MAEKRIKDVVMYMKKCLEKNGIRVSKIIVFGSHARGTAARESDIDMIIVSGDFRGKGLLKRAEMIGDAEYKTVCKFDVAIDVILESPEEFNPGFGVVVYAA
ncbi:MAG: nucleotidyltransferase domain-containing protein [bacterium]